MEGNMNWLPPWWGRKIITQVVEKVTPCPPEIDSIVLSKLLSTLGSPLGKFSVCIGSASKEALDGQHANVARVYKWVLTLEDKCVKKSYLHWLEYWQKELDAGYRELNTQDERKSMAKFREKLDKEWAKRAEYEAAHPVPVPPRE